MRCPRSFGRQPRRRSLSNGAMSRPAHRALAPRALRQGSRRADGSTRSRRQVHDLSRQAMVQRRAQNPRIRSIPRLLDRCPAGWLDRRGGHGGSPPSTQAVAARERMVRTIQARYVLPESHEPVVKAIRVRDGHHLRTSQATRLAWRDLGRPARRRDAVGCLRDGAGGEVLGTPNRPQDIVGDVVAAEAEVWGGLDGPFFAASTARRRPSRAPDKRIASGWDPCRPTRGTRWRWPSRPRRRRRSAAAGSRSVWACHTGRSSRTCTGWPTSSPPRTCVTTSRCVPLLREGSVRHRGRFYQVDGGLGAGHQRGCRCWWCPSPLMVQAAGNSPTGS